MNYKFEEWDKIFSEDPEYQKATNNKNKSLLKEIGVVNESDEIKIDYKYKNKQNIKILLTIVTVFVVITGAIVGITALLNNNQSSNSNHSGYSVKVSSYEVDDVYYFKATRTDSSTTQLNVKIYYKYKTSFNSESEYKEYSISVTIGSREKSGAVRIGPSYRIFDLTIVSYEASLSVTIHQNSPFISKDVFYRGVKNIWMY